jgi:putative thioredoxin
MAEPHATNPNIFDTTAERFMSDVVERSKRQAVAVDFWAPWCGPCRALTPLLEQLVTHYAGGLAVARVNTDAEPAIASQFGIRSIPDVRIFRDGRMVDGFVGVQPLGRLQALFDRYVLPPSDGSREEAERLLESGDAQQAVARLRQLLTKDPSNAALSINLADALVRDGKLEEAEQLLANLPANAGASKEADDFYRLAAHEILRGDAGLGLELLLTILRRDRRFQDGLAQRALLQAFALLGDDDEHVAQTRRKMAALLY